MSAFDIDKNPFCIPDLTPMYERVKSFVKENQGDKGFICTDNPDCDTIWTYVYDYEYFEVHEYEVKAIRVKNDMLQLVFDSSSVKYKEEDVRDMMEDTDCWYLVKDDDCVYFIPTIFNIAENIAEYV